MSLQDCAVEMEATKHDSTSSLQENPRLTFILGGARSGKSLFAERLITQQPAPYLYFATAQAMDEEMRARIATHQQRRTNAWRTIEAPNDLAQAIERSPQLPPALIDCLTLWLTNRLLAKSDLERDMAELLQVLARRDGMTILVSTEIGLGGVSVNPLSRVFCDAAGSLHQRIAALSASVHFIAAGLSMRMK